MENNEAQIVEQDPYRVEIKESASGAKQVSIRATDPYPDSVVEIAVKMFKDTKLALEDKDD